MLQRHRTFYVSCVLVCHRLAIDAANRVNTHCDLGLCLVLYRSENTNGITYGQSRRACSNQSMEAAPITDPSVQQMIPTLLSAFDMENIPGDAWTAGLRLNIDEVWKSLDGTNFEDSAQIEDREGGNCALLERFQGNDRRLVMDQCNEIRGNSYPFCHFTKPSQDSCSSERHFMYKGLCYYVHIDEYGDGGWYDAQNFCHIELGGDVAYKHIQDPELIKHLQQRGITNNLWTGITRRQWRWITPKRNLEMRYFNWNSVFDESITETSVAISSGDFRWRMYNFATRLNYFICSHEDASYTATQAATTTEQSQSTGVASSVDTVPGRNVAAVASAAVVVVVTSVFVLILSLRKKRGCINSQQPDNAQKVEVRTSEESTTDISSDNHRNVLAPSTNVVEYEDVIELTPSQKVYEAITERDELHSSSHSPYEVLTEPTRGNTTAAYTRDEDPNGLGGVQVTPIDNPYEVPSNYINIVDQPNVYDSLKK